MAANPRESGTAAILIGNGLGLRRDYVFRNHSLAVRRGLGLRRFRGWRPWLYFPEGFGGFVPIAEDFLCPNTSSELEVFCD